uniref:Protein kinase domain-containing protein n=1 Tax=Acrobeloides nanus TaxID=290746 RepID=A0A914C4V0_9BILA
MPNFASMDQYIKVSTALPAIKFEHISLARHRAITFRATKHATPFSDVFKEELRRILTANLNCLKSLTNIDLSSIQDFPVESLNLDEYTDTIEVFDDRYMNFFTRLNAKSLKLKICYEDPGSFPLAFLDFSKASELHIEFFVHFMVDAYNIYDISNNFKNEHLKILSITSEYMLDEFSYSEFFMCVSQFYPNLQRFSLTLIQAANKHKCFIEHVKNCESAIEEFRDYSFNIFVSLSGREELSIGVASKEYEDLHETLINAHFVKKKTEELDLSVSNIVVDKKSQLKIIDLGLARPDEKFQNLTGYVCTRYYRAPEIVLGIDRERHESYMLYDRKVDLWSAGCILAEMITGKPLFAGINNLDQWDKIVQVVGSPEESFVQTLPEGIKNFVEQSQKYEPKSWSDIFPDSLFPQEKTRREYLLPMCNSNAARDLLSKLLVIDPVNRFSYNQALEHPYVRWQQGPGELENETNPIQHYNGYIEQLELNENEWKALIFAELKQYELMKAQENGPLEQRHECEKCIQYRCDCSECTKMDLSRLLN